MRPRSATACGLRATALRCSAPRASARGRRRSRPVLAAHRTAPARAPRPRCARQPWAPALLAAPEIARRQPPPPHSTTSPRLGEERLKCAREGERERQARSAIARASVRPIGAPTRPTKRPRPRAVTLGLARLRERTFLSSHLPSEERCRAGRVGVPVSRFRERRGAQAPRVAERSEAEEREARCAAGRQYRPAPRRPRDEALGAEHRSAVARRPQAVADRGRMSETGTPTRPATRGLRAPAARQALRHPAKLLRL